MPGLLLLALRGWLKVGGEQNYWYAEVGTGNPCEYYEGYPTLPFTSNYWRFVPEGFSRTPIPASTFVPPAGCDGMCQLTDMAPDARRAAWVKAHPGSRAAAVGGQ